MTRAYGSSNTRSVGTCNCQYGTRQAELDAAYERGHSDGYLDGYNDGRYGE